MRRATLIGIGAAVVYISGHILLASIPGGGDTDANDLEKFYVRDDDTAMAIAGLIVLSIGCLAMFWFFHELRAHMDSPLARSGFVASAVGLGLVAAGAAILAGPSGVQVNSDQPYVGNNVAHVMAQAGFGVMLVAGSLFLGLGVGMLAVAARRLGALVPWVGIAGIVAAVLQLGAYFWLPLFAIPLWVIIVAITLARARAVPTGGTVPAPGRVPTT